MSSQTTLANCLWGHKQWIKQKIKLALFIENDLLCITKYFYVEEKEIRDDIASIRSLMERSSKFISLSGLSGVLAGVYALVGAGFAYRIINQDPIHQEIFDKPVQGLFYGDVVLPSTIILLALIALLVLFVSIATAVFFSRRKAKLNNQPLWGNTSRALLFHMAVPLFAGGIFILILVSRGDYGIIAPSSLIFYGLALLGAGNFTFSDVKFLGVCEIILGLIAAWLPGYGLLFWAIGFGILHIVYGSVMYLKYDR